MRIRPKPLGGLVMIRKASLQNHLLDGFRADYGDQARRPQGAQEIPRKSAGEGIKGSPRQDRQAEACDRQGAGETDRGEGGPEAPPDIATSAIALVERCAAAIGPGRLARQLERKVCRIDRKCEWEVIRREFWNDEYPALLLLPTRSGRSRAHDRRTRRHLHLR